jgi:FkbM family methyltransferase
MTGRMNRDVATDDDLQSSLQQRAAGVIPDPDYPGFRITARGPMRMALDIGANRGQSIVSLKTLFPHIVIHAFEANPLFHACLKRLGACYGDSISIHAFGLGRATGRLRFYVPCVGNEVYLEESSTRLEQFSKPWIVEKFRERGEMRLEESVVDIRPGDELGLSPDIVKVDVEGAELDVLVGLQNTIIGARPVLLVENSDWDGVTPFLAGLGYEPFRYDADRQCLIPYFGETTNAFYLHRSHCPA